MQTFISHVETWMTQNKLKLYDDKTEALLMKSNRTIFHYTQPTSLRADAYAADVPFKTCACNHGFQISDNITLNPITGTPCKISGLKDAGTCLQIVYFLFL